MPTSPHTVSGQQNHAGHLHHLSLLLDLKSIRLRFDSWYIWLIRECDGDSGLGLNLIRPRRSQWSHISSKFDVLKIWTSVFIRDKKKKELQSSMFWARSCCFFFLCFIFPCIPRNKTKSLYMWCMVNKCCICSIKIFTAEMNPWASNSYICH